MRWTTVSSPSHDKLTKSELLARCKGSIRSVIFVWNEYSKAIKELGNNPTNKEIASVVRNSRLGGSCGRDFRFSVLSYYDRCKELPRTRYCVSTKVNDPITIKNTIDKLYEKALKEEEEEKDGE